MKNSYSTINSTGLKEIRHFLENNHKLSLNNFTFTNEMVEAFAGDAEQSMLNGGTAEIELKSTNTISGHTETFTVSDSGIDSYLLKDIR